MCTFLFPLPAKTKKNTRFKIRLRLGFKLTPLMKYNIIKYTDYQTNQKLVDSIMELIIPSYKNAGSHITHDIEICNELYVINSAAGVLAP